MEYIVLTPRDISFIDNRAVICAISDEDVALFEPIPLEIISFFEGRERVTYVGPEEELIQEIEL